MPFCPNCGFQTLETQNFCPKCGYSLKDSSSLPPIPIPNESKEVGYYKGEANMIVKTVKQQGVATKVGVYALAGPLGYLIWGRDKKKKISGTGNLIVTNKSLHFAGRDYPYERIGNIIKQGKSIFVETDINKQSLDGTGWIDIVRTGITGESCTVELEIQTNDVDGVFNALEQARLSKVRF